MKPFHCQNGDLLRSINDLPDALRKMSDRTYNHHVGAEKNDFAAWVEDFVDKGLAIGLRHATTKTEAVKAVETFIKEGKFIYETIIIGGGFAGIAAAIYASRNRNNFIIIAEDIGGQINVSGEIENYPGIMKTDASKMLAELKKQVEYNKIHPVIEKVKKIKKSKNNHFTVETDNSKYETETIIICSGARPRMLNVPGEKEFAKKGLTYCAVCDGPLFKNKTVAVIGGGDAAMESALFLQRICRKIYLVTKNPQMKGKAYLMERALSKENIEVIPNAETRKIAGNKFVENLEYSQQGKKKSLPVEGVFVDIGRIPNIEFCKNLVKLDDHNHIIVDKFMQTSVKGIFAAGDCTDLHEYQYAIAAGQAVTALLKAVRR